MSFAVKASSPERAAVLLAITREREQQEAAWGTNDYAPSVWLTILAEEFGEVAKAVERLTFGNLIDEGEENRAQLRLELVQVAAVAVAWLERLDAEDEGAEAGR